MEPMVRVRVLKDFRDRRAGLTLRKAGEEYETFSSRARELEGKQLIAIIRDLNIHEIPEEEAVPDEETVPEDGDPSKEEADPEE